MKWYRITIEGRVEARSEEEASAHAKLFLETVRHIAAGTLHEVPEYAQRMAREVASSTVIENYHVGEEVTEPT